MWAACVQRVGGQQDKNISHCPTHADTFNAIITRSSATAEIARDAMMLKRPLKVAQGQSRRYVQLPISTQN